MPVGVQGSLLCSLWQDLGWLSALSSWQWPSFVLTELVAWGADAVLPKLDWSVREHEDSLTWWFWELWELQQNPSQFMNLKKARNVSSLGSVLRYLLHSVMTNNKAEQFTWHNLEIFLWMARRKIKCYTYPCSEIEVQNVLFFPMEFG